MSITRVDGSCVNSLTMIEVINTIYTKIKTASFIYNYLCLDPPNCPTGDLITVKHWACWQVKMINYFGEETIKYQPCNYDAYCEEEFSYCWDPAKNKVVRTYISSTYTGVPDCDLQPWEITIPTEVGEEPSGCFIYQSRCETEE